MHIDRILSSRLHLIFMVAGLLVILQVKAAAVSAQSSRNWSVPQNIPGFDDNVSTPILIADDNQTVHAFSAQWVDDWRMAIVYNRWTLEQGWIDPIDIMLSPLYDQVWYPQAYLDSAGIMHLIFFGGHDAGANIYYTQAPAADAGNAAAWSSPQLIGEQAITPASLALTGNDQGDLFVIYSGNLDGNGIYLASSSDSGISWTEPISVFSTYAPDLKPYQLNLYRGDDDNIYSFWNVVDINGNGVANYVATLDASANKWVDEPTKLADGTGVLGIQSLSMIEHNGSLYLIYDNGASATDPVPVRWIIQSNDGGNTWSSPIRPFPGFIGGNGVAGFGEDSNNTLHVFFGQRTSIGGTDIHGMWHSRLENNNWTPAEAIVSGPLVRDREGNKGFDPHTANVVVSQGNTILVAWRTDPGNGRNGAWYSYTVLDAPELPIKATSTPIFPTTTPAPTVTPAPTATSSALVSASQLQSSAVNLNETNEELGSPAESLFIGIIPVIFIIFIIFIFSRFNFFNR